jgi:hypothetical protein
MMAMKRNPVLLCLIWVFIAGWAHPQAGGSPSAALTLHRLAEMLIPALSLESKLPKTLVALTPEEACRMECGVLAGNGLPIFAGADCDRCVSRGFLAETLFALCHRHLRLPAATPAEKLQIMADRQILPAEAAADCLTEREAIAALNHPQVAASIDAFVRQQAGLGTKPGDPIQDPYATYRLRNVTEGPLSPISPSGRK